MSATSILPARHLMSQLDMNEMKKLADQAINLDNNEAVIEMVTRYTGGKL